MVSPTFFNLGLSFGIRSHDLSYSKLQVLFLLTLKSFSVFGSKECISSVQSLSRVQLFVTTWTAERPACLSITGSRSLPKLMSTGSVMPSNHLIFCPPLLFMPSIFPSTRVFSNESALYIKWPEYWSFSFNISPREV